MKKLTKKARATEVDEKVLEILEGGISNWRMKHCPSFSSLGQYVELFPRGKADQPGPRKSVASDVFAKRNAFAASRGFHDLAAVETHLGNCILCSDDVASLRGLHLAIQKSLPEIKRLPLREKMHRFLAERNAANERKERFDHEQRMKVISSISDNDRGKR